MTSRGKKKCCKYHNDFFQWQLDNDIEFGTDLNDCGRAGMGPALLCCPNCPLNSFYNPNSKKPAWHSSHRPVEYLKDLKREDFE